MRSVMIAAGLLAVLAAGPATAGWELDFESGAVWQSYNDVQIPNDDTGTRFAIDDVTGAGPWFAWRGTAIWNWSERSSLRLMAAPLTISESGDLTGDVAFAGGDFGPGAVDAVFRFDSYRASYRWLLDPEGRWRWWIGFTAKVRDAEIKLTQGDVSATKLNTGFVPLLHVAGHGDLGCGWHFLLELDALAGGPGRAEDLALKIGRDLSDKLRLSAGYRMVEGGADVDEVYTFAWLHYAVASLTYFP